MADLIPQVVAGVLVTFGSAALMQGFLHWRKLSLVEARVVALDETMRRRDEIEAEARAALTATVAAHSVTLSEHAVALAELRGRHTSDG